MKCKICGQTQDDHYESGTLLCKLPFDEWKRRLARLQRREQVRKSRPVVV